MELVTMVAMIATTREKWFVPNIIKPNKVLFLILKIGIEVSNGMTDRLSRVTQN